MRRIIRKLIAKKPPRMLMALLRLPKKAVPVQVPAQARVAVTVLVQVPAQVRVTVPVQARTRLNHETLQTSLAGIYE